MRFLHTRNGKTNLKRESTDLVILNSTCTVVISSIKVVDIVNYDSYRFPLSNISALIHATTEDWIVHDAKPVGLVGLVSWYFTGAAAIFWRLSDLLGIKSYCPYACSVF